MSTIPTIETNNHAEAAPTSFEGFDLSQFVMIPRDFIRRWMQDLSDSELRLMLCIFDHTLGYCDKFGNRKLADAISRSQFLGGVHRTDGTLVDRGAGVSERSLNRAQTGLETKGYITREHRTSASGRPAATVYGLVMKQGSGVRGQESGVRGQESEEGRGHKGSEINPTPANLPPILTTSSTPVSQAAPAEPAIVAPIPAILPPTNPGNLPNTKENLKQERISIQNTQTHSGVGDQGSGIRKDVCVEGIDKSQGDERPVRSDQDGLRDGRKVKPAGAETEAGVKPLSARLDQVTSELLAARISRGKAQSLAVQVIENGHGPGYVGLVLDYISQQKAVKSPPGFLVHLVGTNWQPPAVLTPAAQVVGGTASARTSLPPHLHDISQPTDSRIADIKLPVTPRPDLLDQQIELERGNLAQATNDRQRLIAQARLERYALFKQLLNQHDRVEPEALAELVYQQRQRLVAGMGSGSGTGMEIGSSSFALNQVTNVQEARHAAV